MKNKTYQYRNLKRGATDIALMLSFLAFLGSLAIAFFYFSFEKNLRTPVATATPVSREGTIQEESPVSTPEKQIAATSSPERRSLVPVFIGSYGDIRKEYLEGVQASIEKATGAPVTILGSAAAVAKKSPLYNAKRQQFDIDTLLKGVETASSEYGTKSRFIFIFDVDMYSSVNPSLKSVWTAGAKGRNVSIISLYGLQKISETNNAPALPPIVLNRLQREALHMIGVNIGIPSSPDIMCMMYPVKNLTELDNQGLEYCPSEQAIINTIFAQ